MNLSAEVARLVHSEKLLTAAQAIDEFCKLGLKITEDDPKKYLPVLQHYLHYLLNSGKFPEAAQILWTSTQFTPEPKYTRDVWELFDTSNMSLIMGAGSCSKSFGMCVRLFLEYIRDPQFTSIKVLGPNEDHLEANLFSHLVRLHSTAKLPMPGEVGQLFIGMDRRDQTSSSIKGVTIPIGKVKKAARLQGTKRIPRPSPHPIFGARSRLFVFIDEIENVPGGIWQDIDNILSNATDLDGFKICGAYNPTNQTDEVGKRAEPPFGWENLDPEKHFRWKSTRGWDVLRLDGEKSENVVQGREVFPGLQTRKGLEAMARNAGGRQSPGYYTMGRGLYPPTGVELTVISPGMLTRWRGEFIWYDNTIPVASADLALEGGNAVYTLGKFGLATGIKYPPSLEHPTGHKVMFKDRFGHSIVRYGAQAEQQFTLPKGDSIVMAEKLISLNRKAAVSPNYFSCDRTGAGSGTADLIRHTVGNIWDVNYSESASEGKIMAEDRLTCIEEYERVMSELWLALKKWGEFQYFLIHPSMDMTKLTQQLTQRKLRTAGKKTKVEPKNDYKSRGFESPDEADSLTLFVHACRKGSGVIPSMQLEESASFNSADNDDWLTEMTMRNGVVIDESNRGDYLDDRALTREEAPIL